MSRPDFFARPPEWPQLGDPDAERAQGAKTPPDEPPGGRAKEARGRAGSRGRRARALNGLGSSMAGPDFRWPSAAPSPGASGSALDSSVTELDARPGAAQAGKKAEKRGRSAGSPRSPARTPTAPPTARERRRLLARAVRVLALYAGIFIAVVVVLGILPNRVQRTTPVPTRTPTPALPVLPPVWSVRPGELRTDLAGGAELVAPIDGTFDANRLVAVGDIWVVLTGDGEDRRIAVHGIDASTGRPLWRTDLPNGVCAAAPSKGRLVCAASVATDPATGLGTRWRISLLDPATGRETRGADFAGWLTLIHVDGDRILLVEQRQPAPHAVLTGLDGELRQRWQLDLRDQPQHAGLFSNDRIYYRKLPIPDGPALDRPRIRKVADGLTALWSGQTTAFVDLRSGQLVGMPRCSRLVDDGKRLWCNAGPLAVAYSYTLRKLHETALNTRLAFPYRDPRAGDVTDPVFLEADGRAVRVDPATGRTVGPLAQTRNGSAFGMTISPSAAFVGGLTLVSDSTTLFAVDTRTGALHWRQARQASIGDVWVWRGELLFGESVVRILDTRTGRERVAYRQRHGLYTALVGEVLVGVGPDELARLTDP